VRNPLKPKGHWVQSRNWEMVTGVALFAIGCMLLWDAFDNRGRKAPWPVGALTPW
jgi:hypothetical protein